MSLKTLFGYLARKPNKRKQKELVDKIATAMQRPAYSCILPNFKWLNQQPITELERLLGVENSKRIEEGLEPIL